ncbi:MAG: glycyl radical protein [Chloroflexi bacterium]|nr:MAG: glycyl radical protein [Chloroflexota bacterium]RLC96095.1 MAG: glycyl radical protein [Chloroflexota bacterium]
MDAAIKELRDNVCIKAVKGLYRGQQRIDMGAGYRSEVKICLERARLITEAYKETEGEPMVLRRAKALKKILEGMTIYIQPKERLVGNMASDPQSLPLYPELYWRWLEKALEDEYKHLLDEEGKQELKEIHKYWKKISVHGMERNLVPESIKPFTGYTPVSFFTYTWDMVLPNYEKILRDGLRGYISKAQDKLNEIASDPDIDAREYLEQKRFLEAAIISLEATINFAKRYAALAREMAKSESDPAEKARLEKLAEICDWVPENPARTFHEAMQCFFFIHLIVGFLELPSVGCGVRLDKVMYPYYKKDVEEGRLDKEEALNLVESLWIKFEEMGFLHPPRLFGSAGGGLAWQNVTLGGVDGQGNDVSNDLSYLILDATRELHSVQPPLCFRYHDKIPRDLVRRAIDTLRTGVAQPAFFNDKMMIPYLLNKGIPLEDARDYAISNCMSWIIPGKNMVYRQGMGMFSFPNCMMLALNQGVDMFSGRQVGVATPDPTTFKSIDDIMDAIFTQYRFFFEKQAYINNIADALYEEFLPRPLISALVDDGIDMAADCRKWYYFHRNYVMPSGVNNVADSLAAIKKLVFEEKKITMAELLDALKSNFEGKEELRQMLLSAPKFGNDDGYVDSIAQELHFRITAETQKYTTYYGYPFDVDGTNATMGYYLGFDVPATPEGRKAREPLHDGSVSPVQGRDTKGPSAVLNSVGKVDPLLSCNHLFNQRFAPQFLEGENREIFANYLKTWSDLGIHHVQFNVIDPDTLRDAQEHPERHTDLIVRVAGYAAYFVDLTRSLQDDIIARTEQRLM